jgi:predicted nucleotidyltransferase
MAEIPDRVQKIIEKYFQALKDNKIPINRAFLFGSYAKGGYNEYSDVDIVLVSSIFEGNRFADRNKIRKINLSVSNDLEILPYCPQDFTPEDPFVREILETGIEIA